MPDEMAKLLRRVRSATGCDQRLDRDIARCLEDTPDRREDPPSYTGSVGACISLLQRVMPGWRWHVGFGPRGIMPYASLSKGTVRREAMASTVPLALLTALLEVRAEKR